MPVSKSTVSIKSKSARKPFNKSAMPTFELLEHRQLMAAQLPYRLDFDTTGGSVADRNGRNVGFTGIQVNKNDTQYQPDLIDMDAAAGILKLTSTGSSAAGSNAGTDNTQVNALETSFDGTTSGFSVTTRLIGPLSYINANYQQAGLYFGPDQDNYIKLVAVNLSATNGQYLQFKDETNTGSGPASSLSDTQNRLSIGSFATISTLDLRLVGDASNGRVSAYYSVNGGSFNKISFEYTVPSSKRAAFFNDNAKAGVLVSQKNDAAPITAKFDSFEITAGTKITTLAEPTVTATRPADGATNVPRDTFIAADVALPNVGQGVDSSTLTESSVKLYRQSDGQLVAGNRNSTGGGDAIVFQPTGLLDANTTYVFEVTSGVKDASGAAFAPWKSTFTTGTAGTPTQTTVGFDKTAQTTTQGKRYTSLKMGPDNKLYATTIDGKIIRFDISEDGTLGAGQEINTINTYAGETRTAISIVFDPASTATNLIAYVSNSDFAGLELKEYNSLNLGKADNWTGRITKLTGANLETAQNIVTGLPRSVKDHQTYQMAFGPDGKLYVSQASMNAMGAPDNAWGQKAEVLLSGAILQIDVAAIGAGTINVQTEGLPAGVTPYNPLLIDAPVKIYATGLRSAYDLLFHSNGHLYSGTNGSAAGGNTPAKPGVAGTGLTNVATEDDYFFDVVSGGYYGHPNPTRGEYILNGGNPTAGADPGEIVTDSAHTAKYPVGTQPESTYKGYAYDFGRNYSPNGMIEYHGTAFNGTLEGKILIVRYSGGDDVIALTPSADGNTISAVQTGITGLTGFVNPLDLVQDSRTGFVYVAEFGDQAQVPGAEARITLLRPAAATAPTGTPAATQSRGKVYLSDYVSTPTAGPAQTVRVTNTGTDPLVISAANFTGANAAEFAVTNDLSAPITIAPGAKYDFYVTYTATNALQIRTATLSLTTNTPASPTLTVAVRAIGLANSTGGNNEASLQQILNLYQIPVNVGDATPETTDFQPDTSTSADEVTMPRLVKSGTSPITVEFMAAFANMTSNTQFGWYEAGNSQTKNLLATVPVGLNQSIAPLMDGSFTFDPGGNAFGIYANFTLGSTTNPLNRDVFSENTLNTWETNAGRQKKVRFYQLRDTAGNVVPDAYVFAFEEYNVTFDQNDIVGIIRNVKPAADGPELGLENLDKVPAADRLVFSRITNKNSTLPNGTHDTAMLRLRNTGSAALDISGMALSNSDYVFVSGNGPTSIAPGGFVDVVVKFVYSRTGNGNELRNGTLTINSSDTDEAVKTVALAGIWQSYSENQPNGISAEPVAQTVINAFGYKVNLTFTGQSINTTGVATKVGEEIMSELWQRADTGLPVQTRMLAAYHQQYSPQYTTQSSFNWYNPTNIDSATGKPKVTLLYKHAQVDSQSLYPHLDGSTTAYAEKPFIPTTSPTFGFTVDGANGTWSEDKYNTPNAPNNPGHGFRFYQAKDASGKIIPDTYLAIQDYVKVSYANYDYQDNIYLISNVKPATPPPAPTNFVATGGTSGNALSWKANTEGNVTGYNVYASDSAGGAFVKLNDTPVTALTYLDTAAPAGVTRFYQLVAATYQGQESAAATANATRTGTGPGVVPPTAPTNLVATAASYSQVGLTWTDTSNNELGFKIERRTGSGVYTLLTTTSANATSFADTTASSSTTYTYRVTATNTAGDSVASNESTVTTPANTALSSVDIGNPTPAGNVTTVTPGFDYDVSVGGTDIYGTSDQFNYVYQSRTGDFDVRVQISELNSPDPQGMAGLMARESLAANSRNVIIKARPNDYRMGYRTATGGTTSATGTGTHTGANTWVRLQRVGNVFNTYGSPDGTTWTQIGTVTTALPTTVFLGLATSAHTTTAALTAKYRNFGDTATGPAQPAAVTNVLATAPTPNAVNLTWQDNSANETGFRIERSTAGGAWQSVGTAVANATSFADTTVAPATAYSYRVFAVNSTVSSNVSNTASVTTPAAPTNQTLAPVADAVVRGGTYAGSNFPSDTNYIVKKATGDNGREVFIKFDATTAGDPNALASIKLRLFGRLTGSAAAVVPVGLYGVTDESWTETTITNNNKPAAGATALSTISVSNLNVDQWFEVDVTDYVKQQLALGKTSISFKLAGTAATTPGGQFQSRESGAATAPQLVLTGNNPTPTPVPAAASNVVATANSQTSVTLSWQDNSTTETGFRIERSVAGGAYQILTTVGSDITAFADNSVGASTHYDYRVIAFNSTGDGATSNVASTDTPVPPPTAPTIAASADAYVRSGSFGNTNFSNDPNFFTKLSSGDFTREIYIKFDLSTAGDPNNLTAVKLQLFGRATGSAATSIPVSIAAVADQTWTETGITYNNKPAAGATLATLVVNNLSSDQLYEVDLTAYVKQQLAAGATSISLKIRATAANAAGAQFQSREGGAATAPQLVLTTNTVTPPPPAPTAPAAASNLVASATTPNSVDLTWQDNATTETGYRVERSTAGGAYATVATLGADANAFTDNGAAAQTHYAYRVVGFNAVGDAPASNVATTDTPPAVVTPPPPTVTTFNSVADGYVRDGSANANVAYSAEADLMVKKASAGFARLSYVRFDLSSYAGTAPTSVKLRLYANLTSASASGVQMGVYSVANATWTEAGLTYNSRPASSASPLSVVTVTSTTPDWIEIDLTAYVQAELAAGRKSINLSLQGTAVTAEAVRINSKESPTNAPQLVVV